MLTDTAAVIAAISRVLPIILLLLTGVFLRRIAFLAPETVQDLKKLVVNVTLPALLFAAFSTVALEPRYVVIVGAIFAACLLALLLGRLLLHATPIASPVFPPLLTGFEAGMMGYALFSAVYGQENVFRFGVVDLGQVTFVFFVLVPLLKRQSEGAQPFLDTLQGFLKTPVILAILGGILFNQLGLVDLMSSWPPTASVLETVSLLGSMTTPLIVLAIGYELHFRPGALRLPVLTTAIRLAIWVPAGLLLTHVAISWLNLDPGFAPAIMTMFILPPPFVIPLFMPTGPQHEHDYVLNTLTLATLATLLAFAVVTLLYPPGG